MRLFVCLLLVQISFLSCEVSEVHNSDAFVESELSSKQVSESFVGKDISGQLRQCEETTDLVCTEVFTEEDQFGLECLRNGDLAVQCGCHDWICIVQDELPAENERIGFDLNGEPKTCVAIGDDVKNESLVCTMVFTAEDQFAYECEEAGHEAVQCGCHDWLCVESLE